MVKKESRPSIVSLFSRLAVGRQFPHARPSPFLPQRRDTLRALTCRGICLRFCPPGKDQPRHQRASGNRKSFQWAPPDDILLCYTNLRHHYALWMGQTPRKKQPAKCVVSLSSLPETTLSRSLRRLSLPALARDIVLSSNTSRDINARSIECGRDDSHFRERAVLPRCPAEAAAYK